MAGTAARAIRCTFRQTHPWRNSGHSPSMTKRKCCLIDTGSHPDRSSRDDITKNGDGWSACHVSAPSQAPVFQVFVCSAAIW